MLTSQNGFCPRPSHSEPCSVSEEAAQGAQQPPFLAKQCGGLGRRRRDPRGTCCLSGAGVAPAVALRPPCSGLRWQQSRRPWAEMPTDLDTDLPRDPNKTASSLLWAHLGGSSHTGSTATRRLRPATDSSPRLGQVLRRRPRLPPPSQGIFKWPSGDTSTSFHFLGVSVSLSPAGAAIQGHRGTIWLCGSLSSHFFFFLYEEDDIQSEMLSTYAEKAASEGRLL